MGTLALIVDQVPVICLCTQRDVEEKMISNMVEVKTRDAKVLTFVFEGDNHGEKVSDTVIKLPNTYDLLSPILTVIPLQLIAYYASVKRGGRCGSTEKFGQKRYRRVIKIINQSPVAR